MSATPIGGPVEVNFQAGGQKSPQLGESHLDFPDNATEFDRRHIDSAQGQGRIKEDGTKVGEAVLTGAAGGTATGYVANKMFLKSSTAPGTAYHSKYNKIGDGIVKAQEKGKVAAKEARDLTKKGKELRANASTPYAKGQATKTENKAKKARRRDRNLKKIAGNPNARTPGKKYGTLHDKQDEMFNKNRKVQKRRAIKVGAASGLATMGLLMLESELDRTEFVRGGRKGGLSSRERRRRNVMQALALGAAAPAAAYATKGTINRLLESGEERTELKRGAVNSFINAVSGKNVRRAERALAKQNQKYARNNADLKKGSRRGVALMKLEINKRKERGVKGWLNRRAIQKKKKANDELMKGHFKRSADIERGLQSREALLKETKRKTRNARLITGGVATGVGGVAYAAMGAEGKRTELGAGKKYLHILSGNNVRAAKEARRGAQHTLNQARGATNRLRGEANVHRDLLHQERSWLRARRDVLKPSSVKTMEGNIRRREGLLGNAEGRVAQSQTGPQARAMDRLNKAQNDVVTAKRQTAATRVATVGVLGTAAVASSNYAGRKAERNKHLSALDEATELGARMDKLKNFILRRKPAPKKKGLIASIKQRHTDAVAAGEKVGKRAGRKEYLRHMVHGAKKKEPYVLRKRDLVAGGALVAGAGAYAGSRPYKKELSRDMHVTEFNQKINTGLRRAIARAIRRSGEKNGLGEALGGKSGAKAVSNVLKSSHPGAAFLRGYVTTTSSTAGMAMAAKAARKNKLLRKRFTAKGADKHGKPMMLSAGKRKLQDWEQQRQHGKALQHVGAAATGAGAAGLALAKGKWGKRGAGLLLANGLFATGVGTKQRIDHALKLKQHKMAQLKKRKAA